MNMDLKNEQSLKSYLLGDLNPDEQQRLEQHLMTDSEAFEQLCWIENELIENYLEGSLSGLEKERFETFFLAAPERRQKLTFAKSLKRYVAAHKPKKSYWAVWSKAAQAVLPARNPVMKWALAASLMLVVAGGAWSILQISRLQVALDDEKARSSRFEQEAANLKKIQKPGTPLLAGQIQPTLLVVSLVPGRSRSSDDSQVINVPSGEGWIQLELKMEPVEYPQYQAILQRVEGDGFRTQSESFLPRQFSGLSISTKLLTRGEYVLRLRGVAAAGEIEDISNFYFQLVPQ